MISTVSILGVDDSVSPTDLVDISQMYPFVEWGLNLCSNPDPKPSYPSDSWLDELITHQDHLRLRGVLHGRWEQDMLDGLLTVKLENPHLWNALGRIQVDVSKGWGSIIESLQLIPDKEVIIAVDEYCQFFYDANYLLPKSQLFKGPGYCGYSIIDSDINVLFDNTNTFWLSVDGFRAKDGITMDLLKVEHFLDLAEDYVTNDSVIKALLETSHIQKRLSLPPGIHI